MFLSFSKTVLRFNTKIHPKLFGSSVTKRNRIYCTSGAINDNSSLYRNHQIHSTNCTSQFIRLLHLPREVCSAVTNTELKLKMGDGAEQGVAKMKVLATLERIAPIHLAESWDNVGLLVEPIDLKCITKILLTNDLTEEVLEEALELSSNLIVSYHPIIFSPLKSVTTKSWKERIVATCLQNKVAVYCPHTSWDAVKGGVNDWLASVFDTVSVRPLTTSVTSASQDHVVEIRFANSEEGSEALEDFQSRLAAAISQVNVAHDTSVKISTDPSGETVLRILCTKSTVSIIAQIFYSGPSAVDNSRFKVSKYEQNPIPEHGVGRLCILKKRITLRKIIEMIKKHIGIPHLRLAVAKGKDVDATVGEVALCAGSGASVLQGVKADLYLTGEMPHHDLLNATQNGIHVIVCNHSDSERGFLKPFAQRLSEELEQRVEVIVSQRDRDPLVTV